MRVGEERLNKAIRLLLRHDSVFVFQNVSRVGDVALRVLRLVLLQKLDFLSRQRSLLWRSCEFQLRQSELARLFHGY